MQQLIQIKGQIENKIVQTSHLIEISRSKREFRQDLQLFVELLKNDVQMFEAIGTDQHPPPIFKSVEFT